MLVFFTARAHAADGGQRGAPRSLASRSGREHLRNPRCAPRFGIGFCILFAFIGTFTYVNFVLVPRAARARA